MVYGYGNPGRRDDGLGNAVVDNLEQWIQKEKIENITLDSNYQLNIEDAAEIADKDVVIFVDASEEKHVEDFIVTKVKPTSKVHFTMHAVSPGFILNLTQEIYSKQPMTYLIHIRGYEWDLNETLTDTAKKNLDKALHYIKQAIKEPERLEKSELITKP